MTESTDDAFTVLSAPAVLETPDPAFAIELRARLVHALALPKGVVPVTSPRITDDQTTQPQGGPVGAAIPYLAVDDLRAAIVRYGDIFGAEVIGEPYVEEDHRIGHCELRIGAGVLYLSDAHAELGVTAPVPNQSSVSMMLTVADADQTLALAEAAGGHRDHDREPYDGYGQRNAWLVDPFGHRWGLNSPLR